MLLSPIIYEISEIGVGEMFWRSGSYIEFEGTFPCDKNGNPILKWIGLRIENAGEITCTCKGSMRGRLLVELKPNTMIYALNIYNNRDETDDYWCFCSHLSKMGEWGNYTRWALFASNS